MCAGFDGCVLSSSGSGQQQAAIHMWSGADAKKRVAPTVPTVQHHALGNGGEWSSYRNLFGIPARILYGHRGVPRSVGTLSGS